MTCGDILLVNYPFTDASGSKLRPVLVVFVDAYNKGDDLIFVPISSAPNLADLYIYPIRDTDAFFEKTGLKHSSFVKWTKPLTISRRVVHRKLGRLPRSQVSEIQEKIKSLFGG